MLEILRKLSLTKPMLVHAYLCDFLDSQLGKLRLKIVIVRTPLHGSIRSKMCSGSFQNVHRRPMKYNFGDGWTWSGYPRGLCLGCSPMYRSSSHIWQLATWLWAATLHTHLIWPIEITSCFRECSISYKGLFQDFSEIQGGLGYRSRYSDSLRHGRSGGPVPVGVRISAASQTGPGPTQPFVQWVPLLSPGGKAAETWRWTPTLV